MFERLVFLKCKSYYTLLLKYLCACPLSPEASPAVSAQPVLAGIPPNCSFFRLPNPTPLDLFAFFYLCSSIFCFFCLECLLAPPMTAYLLSHSSYQPSLLLRLAELLPSSGSSWDLLSAPALTWMNVLYCVVL